MNSDGLPDFSRPDPYDQIRRQDFIRKRSLDEFQQQQQQGLGFYLRNMKSRPNYYHESPISPLSPVDFSPVSSISSEITSGSRYRVPIFQQQRLQPLNVSVSNASVGYNVSAGICYPNLAQNRGFAMKSEKDVMNRRLQELEKQLLGDDDEEEDNSEDVSVVTNSEWSDTIQNLIGTTQKLISPSPTSSSSSSCSTFASPPPPCAKRDSVDAAAAISEGKPEVAAEILTRLQQVAHARGTSEQRLASYMVSALKSRVNPTEAPASYMVSALKSRVNPTEAPASASELYGEEHAESTHLLYDFSPCFKLGFMAANLAIIEASFENGYNKIHVVDFEIGQGAQYVHLLHALAAKRKDSGALKITAFTDFPAAGEERLKAVGDGLKALAYKIGVSLSFVTRNLNINCLNRENLEVQSDEALAVNFAFKLYQLPDESVSTENLRDDLLRRVKALSPAVMTVVEQEMNTNTAPLTSRVRDTCEHYAALFDSLDATVSRDNSERVKIEEGLGRRMGNSVACEGRERAERCEVFGKWRARMSMAGFQQRPMSQLAVESLRAKLNSGTRVNPGFSVNEESGGICFGWMGRILTVASAWR